MSNLNSNDLRAAVIASLRLFLAFLAALCFTWAPVATTAAGTSSARPAAAPSDKYVYTSAFPSLPQAAEEAAGKTLVVDSAITISEDTTIRVPNGAMVVVPGGMLIVAAGAKVTLTAPFSAPPIAVFAKKDSHTPVGKVAFTAVEQIYPEWWGACGDGKSDNTEALQRMFDATYDVLTGSYRAYHFLEGKYLINGTVTINPAPVPGHFGIQNAPTLIGSGMGSVTSYLGIGTTFIKNTSGPMLVIAGTYDVASDTYKLDSAAHANPKYFSTERIRFTSTLKPEEVLKVKPIGIMGESRHARIRDTIFSRLWTGFDTRGYSDYSLYEGCIFDCYKAIILRSSDATAFIRCQFGETFVLQLQKAGDCGPAITMSGGDVKLLSCSMNYYMNNWAISLNGSGFPVLAIDDLHAEGCLLLNANCTPFKGETFSGARLSLMNSRIGGNPGSNGKSSITLNHIDGMEITNSVFYELPGRTFPRSLFDVSNGNLVVRNTSFIQRTSREPYEGKKAVPGSIEGPGGKIVIQP
jgi:hypothetical protein